MDRQPTQGVAGSEGGMRNALIKASESRQIVLIALADAPGWWSRAKIISVGGDSVRFEVIDDDGQLVAEDMVPIASVLRLLIYSREENRKHLERCGKIPVARAGDGDQNGRGTEQ